MHRFPEFRLPTTWEDTGSNEGGRLGFALQLAKAAADVTLRYFRTDAFRVERKNDRSPVTLADKEAEQTVRSMIAERFPDDGMLGEEFGGMAGSSQYEWIIDPIDGTKSFISGVPLYSTLVGLTHRGVPTVGVIAIPALGELVIAATGRGAWYGDGWYGDGSSSRISAEPSELRPTCVSNVETLADGLFLVSQVDNFDRRAAGAAYRSLESAAYISRSWGDGYGYLLVATGRAELMVDPIVNPWDVAAVAPVIVEAGGKFSSWSGAFDIRAGHCLASNARVHNQAMEALRPFADHPLTQ